MQIQGLAFAGIASAEAATLARFLAGLVGGDATEADGIWRVTGAGGEPQLAVVPPDGVDGPSDTIIGFLVDDVVAATAELVARGVELDGPLHEGAGLRWQHFRGPERRAFELVDRRGPR